MGKTRILALGDVHEPFGHRKALEWVYRLADEFKPTHVVQVGDVKDLFAFSRYPKVLKMQPEEELIRARAATEKLWQNFKGLSCFQLMGNHDQRVLKKAISVAPELASLVGKSLRELYSYPGVTTVWDDREELFLKVGGQLIAFQHGHRSKLGDHARYNGCNTVCGHSHHGGVWFDQNARGLFWELNVGFLGDIRSPAFGYRAQKSIHKTTLGAGTIAETYDSVVPTFIPYVD